MSDPDLELRTLLERAMHEAMPDRATEERVLEELLSRLPQVGPGPSDIGDVTSNTPPTADAALLKSSGLVAGKASKTLVGVLLSVTVGGAIAATVGSDLFAEGRSVNTTISTTSTAAPAPTPTSGPTPTPTPTVVNPLTTERAKSPNIQQPAPEGPRTTTQEALREDEGGTRAGPRREYRPQRTSPQDQREADSTVTTTEPVDTLAIELSLIHNAKQALTRREYSRVLEIVEEHARVHPTGQLIVERRALEVMALCRNGDPRAEEKLRSLVREFDSRPATEGALTWCEDAGIDTP